MIIGLTGGIGSGKSTASAYLNELGAIIIDADKIAHQILEKGSPAYKRIIERFSVEILGENAEIDRSHLAKIIFNNLEKKKALESITHPLIINEIIKRIKENQGKERIIVVDAPLLFETGLERVVDETWVIYVDEDTQLQRLIFRDKLSYQEAKRRIQAQLSLERKRELADFVIDNNGNLKELKNKVLLRWREINEN